MQNRAVIFESSRSEACILLIGFNSRATSYLAACKKKDRSVGRRTAERVGFSASSITVESHDASSISRVNSESTPTATAMDVSTRATGADELKTLRSLPLIVFSANYIFLRATWRNSSSWRCQDSLRKKKARQRLREDFE